MQWSGFRRPYRGVARLQARARIAIALTDGAMNRLPEVAAACRALGFEHDSTLRDVGVLTGSAAPGDLPRLRAVPGVLAIETARQARPRVRALHA
jgi:hypothetical protein